MSVLGRNDPCPCGSGRKAKKCHEQLIGLNPAALLATAKANTWAKGIEDELAAMEGFSPRPEGGADGWSRDAWRLTGCPFLHDRGEGLICNKGLEDLGRCCSPTCGV